MKKIYLLEDARVITGHDDCTVFETQENKPKSTPEIYGDAIWVEYDFKNNEATNPRLMFEIYPHLEELEQFLGKELS